MESKWIITFLAVYLISFIVLSYVTIRVIQYYPEYVLGGLASLYVLGAVFVGVIIYFISEKSKERQQLEEYYKWRQQYQFGSADEKYQEQWRNLQQRPPSPPQNNQGTGGTL